MRNIAKLVIAWGVVAFLWSHVSTFINVRLMADDWATVHIFREWDDEQAHMMFLNLAYAAYAGAAVWLCSRYMVPRGGPWIARGLEVGLFLSLVTHLPMMLSNYTTYPLPGIVVVKEILFFSVFTMVVGIGLALLYRKEIEAATPLTTGANAGAE